MKQYTVAILGTGVVGVALAKGFIAAGHKVIFGTRTPAGEKASSALAEVPGATAASHSQAASAADLAVVALPWSAVAGTLSAGMASALAGKVVIDATNPLDFPGGVPVLAVGHTDSAGEAVQRLLPGARVVKAFNIITAGKMVRPHFDDGQADMFIAGNDEQAKGTVAEILRQFGWRGPIDLGGIEQSRLLEPLAMIWITYGFRHQHWSHGFSLLGQQAS